MIVHQEARVGAHGFRDDINGLRALAVIAVVLFHFDLAGFTGGFVGVDVFFVISGYLMTAIIAGAARRGRFSFVDFYIARAKRILPALIVVTLVTLAAGALLLLPDAFMAMTRQGKQAVLFAINFAFADTSDYFAPALERSWFLHCWSLAVEIQFYLVVPFVIVLAHRLSPRYGVTAGLAATLLASLTASWFMTAANPQSAFYLPYGRVWEFAAGGLVAELAPATRWQRRVALVGAAAIAAACFLFNAQFRYPGCWPLLPVGGAALIIWARSDTILLTNRVAQCLGNISYSVYLWHWPVLMAGRTWTPDPGPIATASELAAVAGLSLLTYQFVEVPFRRVWRGAFFVPLASATAAILAVAGVQRLVVSNSGFPGRLSPEIRKVVETGVYGYGWRQHKCLLDPDQTFRDFAPECFATKGDKPTLALVGDSTVAQFYPGLIAQPWISKFDVEQLTASGCNFFGHIVPPTRPFCGDIQKRSLDWLLESKPDIVMISAARGDLAVMDSLSFEKVLEPNQRILSSFIGRLKRDGIGKVVVVGTSPVWREPLAVVFARDSIPVRGMSEWIAPPAMDKMIAWDHAMRRATEDAGGVYVSVADLLCRNGKCQALTASGAGSILMQFDIFHLTDAGAAFVVQNAIGPAIEHGRTASR